MRRRIQLLVGLVVWLGLAPGAATAAPIVYFSPLDDGGVGVDPVPAAGPVSLFLYFDGDEPYLEFALFLNASGLELVSFTPDAGIDPVDVAFTPGPDGTLSVLGGNAITATVGETRLGDLVVSTAGTGSLQVGFVPSGPESAFTSGTSFALVPVPDQVVATVFVPEPSTGLLLGLGLLSLARRRRRA